MTEREWKAYQVRTSKADWILRFLDRWIPRLAWTAFILAAGYFGGGVILWIVR